MAPSPSLDQQVCQSNAIHWWIFIQRKGTVVVGHDTHTTAQMDFESAMEREKSTSLHTSWSPNPLNSTDGLGRRYVTL